MDKDMNHSEEFTDGNDFQGIPPDEIIGPEPKSEDIYSPIEPDEEAVPGELTGPDELWSKAKHLELDKHEPALDAELEMPTEELAEQDITDDPVRIYLHEIGRVNLLNAENEKILARQMEEGKHINTIRQKYSQQHGRPPSATETILAMLQEPAQVAPIIELLQEQLGLKKTTGFIDSVYNTKLHDSIDKTLDPQLIQDIATKLHKSTTEIEEMLIKLSLSSRLIPEEVRNLISKDIALSDIDKLVTDKAFIDSFQAHERQFSAHFADIVRESKKGISG